MGAKQALRACRWGVQGLVLFVFVETCSTGYLSYWPSLKKRAKMSLELVATTKCLTGSPAQGGPCDVNA